MTDTTRELPEDAEQTPPPAAPEPAPLPEPAIAEAIAKRPKAVADVLTVIAAAFLAVGALALAGFLLPHTGTSRVYDLWDVDALFGPEAIGLLAAAVLLVPRRTRPMASGLVLGALPLWFAEEIGTFRPSTLFARDVRASGIFLLVAAVFFLVAFGLLLAAALTERGAGAARRPSRSARKARLLVLLTGIVGLAVFVTGRFMNWQTTAISVPGGQPAHSSCCSIGEVAGWTKTEYVVGALVLLGLVVAATAVRPRLRGAGLLFGATYFLLGGLAEAVEGMVAPLRSEIGLTQIVAQEHLTVTVGPVAGFWIAVLGAAFIAGTAVLRLTLDPGLARKP
ncbi:MAG TPA: hypothetical protein VGX23_09925 [Actinocrinis sp.]|nr:hypothetical protein [Actinocrinis sp.]